MFSLKKVNSFLLKHNPHKTICTNPKLFQLKKVETCKLGILVKNVVCIKAVTVCDQLYSKVVQHGLGFS